MKKLVLATAIAALSITTAQAAPTLYGKAFLTLDVDTTKVKGGTSEDGRTKLNSNASRIGIKGSEALTQNTDAIYQLEYGVKVDADGSNFTSRDTYIGLKNKNYGTLLAGRLTAIDGRVDYANVTNGAVLGGDAVQATFDAPRANNTLAYVSPSYNGATFSAMYTLDENNATDNLGRDAFGVAAQFEPEAQPFRAGASYIRAGKDNQHIRVSGAYDLTSAATVGALYQNSKYAAGKENAFTVSGQLKTQTPWTAYAQADFVTDAEGFKDSDKQRLVVGGKYSFTKNATGHIYGAFLNQENALDTVEGKRVQTKDEVRGAGIGGGLEYKF